MEPRAEELMELMERGAEGLSSQIIDLLDGEGDAQKLGEAYSMWVLPSAIMIFSAKEESPEIYSALQAETDEMERSLGLYLENPCRERLVQVGADWIGARAVSRQLLEELSA